MGKFIIVLFRCGDLVYIDGHAVIDDDRAVCGIHDDVSFRQVEMDDSVIIQYFYAIFQTGVYVEYLVFEFVFCRGFFIFLQICAQCFAANIFGDCGEIGC